jgi:hypothetical protein
MIAMKRLLLACALVLALTVAAVGYAATTGSKAPAKAQVTKTVKAKAHAKTNRAHAKGDCPFAQTPAI